MPKKPELVSVRDDDFRYGRLPHVCTTVFTRWNLFFEESVVRILTHSYPDNFYLIRTQTNSQLKYHVKKLQNHTQSLYLLYIEYSQRKSIKHNCFSMACIFIRYSSLSKSNTIATTIQKHNVCLFITLTTMWNNCQYVQIFENAQKDAIYKDIFQIYIANLSPDRLNFQEKMDFSHDIKVTSRVWILHSLLSLVYVF